MQDHVPKQRGRPRLTGLVFLLAIAVQSAAETGWWSGNFHLPGVRGEVRAVVTNGAEIYLGGRFTAGGGVPALTQEGVIQASDTLNSGAWMNLTQRTEVIQGVASIRFARPSPRHFYRWKNQK